MLPDKAPTSNPLNMSPPPINHMILTPFFLHSSQLVTTRSSQLAAASSSLMRISSSQLPASSLPRAYIYLGRSRTHRWGAHVWPGYLACRGIRNTFVTFSPPPAHIVPQNEQVVVGCSTSKALEALKYKGLRVWLRCYNSVKFVESGKIRTFFWSGKKTFGFLLGAETLSRFSVLKCGT